MVRWIVLACTVIILTMAGTFAVWYEPEPEASPPVESPQSDGPMPKVKLVGQSVYDFGTMPKKTKGAHSWVIQNVGDGELELWLEQTSCSCTVAKLDNGKSGNEGEKKRVRIPPGGSTPIEVNWETREWVRFYQTATLGTNDIEIPAISLTVRGRVLFPVEAEPAELAFPAASDEEASRSELTLLSPDRPGLKVTKVTSSKPDRLVAEIRPMSAEELKARQISSGYHVVVEVKPGMPVGQFREVLVFQTDHPQQPELKVTVAGKVAGPISVFPRKLAMPSVSGRDGASQVLTLTVRGGKETHFRVARAPGNLQVAIAADEGPGGKGRYRMRVTVPPGSPTGLLDKPIILKTDHPKAAKLEIPVSIYVSQAKSG
jgi:hypothetical protein